MGENADDFEIGSFSCQASQDASLYKLQERNLDFFFKSKNVFLFVFTHGHSNSSLRNTKQIIQNTG